MRKLSKRMLSLVLSVLMVVTMLPTFTFTAFATETDWQIYASTDFEQFVADGGQYQNTDKEHRNRDGVGDFYYPNNVNGQALPTTSEGGYSMSFNEVNWEKSYYSTSVNHKLPLPSDNSGIKTGESASGGGYFYLSKFNNQSSTYPFAGVTDFKVDIQFKYLSTPGIGGTWIGDDDSCMFKLSTNTGYAYDTDHNEAWSNNFFSQALTGKSWNAADGNTGDTSHSGTGFRPAPTDKGDLSTNTWYHYVMAYEKGRIYSYVTNESGKRIIDYGSKEKTLNPSTITGMYIGACHEYYLYDFVLNNVKIYTGSHTDTPATKDPARDKYLFAYFTGQSGQANGAGEKICFAVSDDGLNFEALNGNLPILDNTPSRFYPADGNSRGIAASGKARDPYIVQARNNDGSLARGYYIMATDLQVSANDSYNNTKLLFWYVSDLTDLDSAVPWCVETTVWFDVNPGNDYVAWAPEAIWDEAKNMYMLYWSTGGTRNYNYIGMHYAYTRDFRTFYDESGVELGNGNSPSRLLTCPFNTSPDNENNRNIDGNITFDGNKYWLYFKKEGGSNNQQIYYCTATRPNGPYTAPVRFSDPNYTNKCEGCEVYQLNDGNYMLMMDHYDSNIGTFLTYKGTLGNFSTTQTTTHINHLSPRHGQVTYITTSEYNALVAKYGKTPTWTSGVENGKEANDYLIARYFTNNNVTNDATGNGNTLTPKGANFTMNQNSGEVAADFVTVAGQHGTIDTSNWARDYGINAKDGITFDWNAKTPTNTDWVCQMINWTSRDAYAIGTDGHTTSDTNYLFLNAGGRLEANLGTGSSNTKITYDKESASGTDYVYTGTKTIKDNNWHRYTLTIKENTILFYIDGEIQYVNSAGPLKAPPVTADFFNNASRLIIGASSYYADRNLDYYGYMKDFKVYNRALTYEDVSTSITELASNDPGSEVSDDSAPKYYDPMETMAAADSLDGTAKTNYGSNTVEDNTCGNVLTSKVGDAAAGAVTSHNPEYYAGASTDSSKGYTISMMYNPGATINNNSIFSLGSTSTGNPRVMFALAENGNFRFIWDSPNGWAGDYMDYTGDVFDGKLATNKWQQITIKVVPSGDFDKLYFYIDGEYTSVVDMWTNTTGNHVFATGSMRSYLHQSLQVAYFRTHGYTDAITNASEKVYMDDFRIYNGLYTASSIHENYIDTIGSRILSASAKDYEDKMKDLEGKSYVYTNMADAYETYDEICRYEDATLYGGDETDLDELVTLSERMATNLAAMKKYTKPTTVNGYAVSGKNTVSEKYTHNMITQPTGLYTPTATSYYDGDKSAVFITGSDFVWLYTGMTNDTPVAPFNMGFGKGGTLTWSIRGSALYMTNSVPMTFGNLGLRSGQIDSRNIDEFWYVFDTEYSNTSSLNWLYETSGGKRTVSTTSSTNSNWRTNTISRNKWVYGSGYGYFNGNENTFLTSNSDVTHASNYTKSGNTYSYLITFTPTYHSKDQDYKDDRTPQIGSTGTIKVINYKHVYEVLANSDRVNMLSQIYNKEASDAKVLLQAYDDLTGIDYIAQSTSNVATLAANLKTKVESLEAVDLASIDDKADLDDLREVLAEDSPQREKLDYGNHYSDPDISAETDNSQYTTDSWDNFVEKFNALQKFFADLNPTDEDQEYPSTAEEGEAKKTEMLSAINGLNPVANYKVIDETMETPAIVSTFDGGNYSGNTQLYTYSSWMAFANAYREGETLHSTGEAARLNTPKYATNSSGVDTSTYSTQQNNIINTDSEIKATKSGLTVPDTASAYESYDAALTVVNSLDMDMYNTAGVNYINDAKNTTLNVVYKKLNAEEAAVYSATSGKSFNVNDLIRNSTERTTDAQTVALLSASTTINSPANKATYIKKLIVKFSWQKDDEAEDSALELGGQSYFSGGSEAEYYYGDTQTFSIPDEPEIRNGYTVANWSISMYPGDASTDDPFGQDTSVPEENRAKPEGSQKISGAEGYSISRVITKNMTVCASLVKNSSSQTNNRYNIYDAYNRLVDVVYSDNTISDVSSVATEAEVFNKIGVLPKKIPFYAFQNWTVTSAGTKTFNVKPNYNVDEYEKTCVFTFIGADTSGATALYDKRVTVNIDSAYDSNFAAWAVRNGSVGDYTYQIVSYSPSYTFFAVTNETYVALISDGAGGYKTVDNDPITAVKLEGQLTNIGTTDSDKINAFVNSKIHDKIAFVSVENVYMSDDNTQARLYVRVSEGAKTDGKENLTSYGVLFYNGNADEGTMVIGGDGVYRRAVTNKLFTGQFTYTLNSKTYFSKDITFRAYVNYDYTYTVSATSSSIVTTDETINGTDYSAVVTAEIN